MERVQIENWNVDYGNGPEPIRVPHAWRQDVSVEWEGPARYSTVCEVPHHRAKLRFCGVCYEAEVSIEGKHVLTHRGIWDAFDVSLEAYAGKRVAIEVKVLKNGGPTYPVKEVASGFLPFVFNPFGGIFREVELIDAGTPLSSANAPDTRVRVEGPNLFIDGQPTNLRGLLTWGWYPDLGHPNPTDEIIRHEVREAKRLGFNLTKFCLWAPPHRYLEILEEEGMFGWMELPIWDPSSDPERLDQIAQEVERIVRQYRHHDNIVCWTIGCELSTATSPAYRQRLVQLVKSLTGCPLVKDNSGGAEMYGGDLREFGDFEDYHPYCDTPFYPVVLDCLQPVSRVSRPQLLGEFNDIDVHRDLARLADELPYWASNLTELNAVGVRWQHDLPGILAQNRFCEEPKKNGHRRLMESSRRKALFIRKFVHEAVRARDSISGYVVTGIRDTPIASSGFFDNWGKPRYTPSECLPWNGPDVLFLLPIRRPPWINGGNRSGWLDPYNWFTGQVFFKVGINCERETTAGLIWRIEDDQGKRLIGGAEEAVTAPYLTTTLLGQINWDNAPAGVYHLHVEFAGVFNQWTFHVVAKPSDEEMAAQKEALESRRIEVRLGEGTIPMPFWREAAYEFAGNAWGLVDAWERLLAISPDRALDPNSLGKDFRVVINRIDTRTYAEHPIAVEVDGRIVTTLRPEGGLGIQPEGLLRNASGCQLLRDMLAG